MLTSYKALIFAAENKGLVEGIQTNVMLTFRAPTRD